MRRAAAIALLALGVAADQIIAVSPTVPVDDTADFRPVTAQPETPSPILPVTTEAPGSPVLPSSTNEPSSNVAPASSPVPVVGQPAPGRTTTSATGTASWYCLPGQSACTKGYDPAGMFAAAGPALRVGSWRGRFVAINGIRVQLIDWCSCPSRIIDLYSAVFAKLAPLSRGVITVTVRW